MTGKRFSLAQLADILSAEYRGDPQCVVSSVAPLHKATQGQLTFLGNSVYRKYLATTQAEIIIVTAADVADAKTNVIIMDNPNAGFAKIAHLFEEQEQWVAGIHRTAVVGENCKIDPTATIEAYCVIENNVTIEKGVVIGAGCSIGRNCRIGANTRLWPRVVLYHAVRLGERCLIHSGVVIGSDGFGLTNEKGRWQKIPQLGGVTIGDDVEIGANTTVDRGALEDTIIEEGVKLDNQIQVAHNVVIGANTAIAGCVAIAGSVRIGKNCAIGGGTCITGHITIADNVTITGMSGVYTSIEKAGLYSSGTGVMESRTWMKNLVRLRQLDELARKLLELEKTVKNTAVT